MDKTPAPTNYSGNFGSASIPFQLERLTIKQKSDFSWGKKIAEDISSKVNGGTSSYFWVRNQRWKTNRNYAHGRINMSRFQDLLEFNGKQNYININWLPIHVVNRVVSGLVGRWMNRSEKIYVTATDPLSTKEKNEQYEMLEFYIANREKIAALEQESGVKLLPEELPADKEELKVWKAQFQKTPEEIAYEYGCNDVLASCGWFDVLKEKMLHDSAETGFVATYTWMDEDGVIHVELLKPENCFYSYSNFPDFRDTTWRGVVRTMKISELRKKYGREFNPNNPNALSEEQLFQLAQTAKEYQLYDNITWITEWNVTFLRPYDEWNIDVLEFEWKTVDSEPYTVITTKKNKSTIIKKGRPSKPADNEKVVEDSRINIYRGVYARSTQTMLEWGLKKNMIRPQDPKEIGNAEFSYSFYMVQSYDMTSLGIPEKIQEPADQMIIARLKIQQLIAKSRPFGTAVNWEAVQNIDYGLGDSNKAIDFKKLFDQTGDFYYREKDAEGNPIGVPFQEISNAGFLPQLQGLIELYRFHYNVMKDELGEDPNLVSQALQPRVTAGNVEASQQSASDATNYYYNAYVYCMQDTARKISCLLKDSVTYGAKVYRELVGQQDVYGRIFSTKIQLLPDQYDIQKFEAMMNAAIVASPDLVSFIDPFQIMRVAKEDVKMAEAIFRQGQKKMIIHNQQAAMMNQQQTIEGQIASAQAAEQAKQQTEALKGEISIKEKEVTAKAQNQSAVVNLVASLLTPQTNAEGKTTTPTIPAELQPLVRSVVENIMITAVASTEEQKMKIIAEMQAAREQQAAQQQQNIQPTPVNNNPQVAV